MPIRAFSAQRFYALTTGSPIDPAQPVITLDSAIPERGVSLVAPDLQGETEYLWSHGVAALGEQRERFIEKIRQGAIPIPLSISNGSTTHAQVRYRSLELLYSRGQTIASLLGLTEPIVAAAKKARWAQCPRCAQSLPIFHTAGELCEHLVHTSRGYGCTIELWGSEEEVSSWASAKGFTVTSRNDGRASVRIDSLTIEPEALRNVEPILSSTKQLPHTWLVVNNGPQHDEYAWHGRCTRCNHSLAPFYASAARDLIERPTLSPTSHEGCRILDGKSLRELLSLPLEQALKLSLVDAALDPLQVELIHTLPLTNLTLSSRTTEIAPRTLALVALVDLARDSQRTGELRIFKVSAALFSDESLVVARACVEKLSQNSGFVWITDEREIPPAPPISVRPAATSRCLGSVTLNAETAMVFEIHTGQWISVQAPFHPRHPRFSALIHDALSEKKTELVSCELSSPVTSHFVPLEATEPSSTRLIAHALGVIEPLAKMFAASHQAKMLGLSARDFAIGQLRQSATVCTSCKGQGVLFEKERLHASVEPCHTCWGSRFRSPVREVTFKGRTLWEILNTPLSASQDTLRALPKMKEVFELTNLLQVANLPLGMPVALLSAAQRRALAIVHSMLSGTTNRPAIIIVEEPAVGFSDTQRRGLESALAHSSFTGRTSWIGVHSS
ncbi:MAG: hypothetical protein RL518_1852 [Pseudomonadota bacterium]